MGWHNDDTTYIKSLIAEGEHVRQDFKYEISDSRKIARTISAFANTEGGRLLIGVKDNGGIAGVRSEEEMYMVDAAASVYCSPEASVEMKAYRAEGRTVLIASVLPAACRPVTVREADSRRLAYVRIGDENFLASPVHIGAWKCAAGNSRIYKGQYGTSFTAREKELLEILASRPQGLTLAQICRKVAIPRRTVIQKLSLFVHWGITEIVHDGKGFLLRSAE